MEKIFCSLQSGERLLLLDLQRRALTYFIENQVNGWMLDRQRNHAPGVQTGLLSSSSTGMGLIALALAAKPQYKLLSRKEAIERVGEAINFSASLPHDHGMLPHFLDAVTCVPRGTDRISTVDTGWLMAGAMVSAAMLRSPQLVAKAKRLYDRVDWHYWTSSQKNPQTLLLCHGKRKDGTFIANRWDRLNAETAFLYLLSCGAKSASRLPRDVWFELQSTESRHATANDAAMSLGLFVFQYSLGLLDSGKACLPFKDDLLAAHRNACQLQVQTCRTLSERFETYKHFWGLSAGDGPGNGKGRDQYCAFSAHTAEGTAHVTATLASIEAAPELVALNLQALTDDRFKDLVGRYGASNVNVDRNWMSRDVVGIDLGAAVMAIDNYLNAGRVRRHFHSLPCVKRACRLASGRAR